MMAKEPANKAKPAPGPTDPPADDKAKAAGVAATADSLAQIETTTLEARPQVVLHPSQALVGGEAREVANRPYGSQPRGIDPRTGEVLPATEGHEPDRTMVDEQAVRSASDPAQARTGPDVV
jgi:hypothetical protein